MQCMRSHLSTASLNTLWTKGDDSVEERKGNIKIVKIIVPWKSDATTLTHPKDVNSAYQLLMGCRDFFFDVLVKAWLYFQELGQGRKVI